MPLGPAPASRHAESGHPAPAGGVTAAGFRMPLAEPGLHLSICTGLSIDVYAYAGPGSAPC